MRLTEITPWNWFKKEGGGAFHELSSKPLSTDPMQRMSRLHQEMDHLFNEVMQKFGVPSTMEALPRTWEEGFMLQPNLDIKELDDRFEIVVEVPGVDEKDLHIDLAENMLIIQGEKKQELKEEKGDYHRRECAYGSFKRELNLPENIDKTKVSATFKNGLLTVALAKKDQVKPKLKHIEIKH